MIVWLASYPRSGNTFMRVLLNACFGLNSYSRYNDTTDIGADPELAKVVGHLSYDGDWESFYDRVSKSNDRVIIKTHNAPLDSAKTIYIARDPRATIVSFHAYLEKFSTLELNRKNTILGATAFGSWGAHVASWNPIKREDTLIVYFEELVRDPLSIARKVGAFLGIEVESDTLPSFENLKKISPGFFRSGSNKKNISELDQEELNLVGFLFRKQMKALGYEPENQINRNDALRSIFDTSKDIWRLQYDIRTQTEENKLHMDAKEKKLATQHADEIKRVRVEQKEFIDQLLTSIQSTGTQTEALAKQSIALTEKFEKTNDQLESLWEQKAELTATVEILRNARSKLSEENQKLTAQRKTMSEEAAQLREELKRSAKKVADTNEKTEGLWKRKSELTSTIEILENTKDSLSDSLRKSHLQNEELVAEVSSNIEKIDDLNRKLNDALSTQEERSAQNEELVAEISLNIEKIDDLSRKLNDALSTQEERNAQILELERRVDDLQSTNLTLESNIKAHRAENKKLDSKIAYRDRALERVKLDLVSARSLAQARSEETETLRTHLVMARDRIDSIQDKMTEFSFQRIAHEKMVRALEDEAQKLRDKVQKLSDRNHELNAKYTTTKEQYLEMNAAVAPRIKSMLSLRPMRYVWNKRQLIKRGDLHLDPQGLPVPAENTKPISLEAKKFNDTVAVDTRKVKKQKPKPSIYSSYELKKPLGIAVYTFDRKDSVENVLESLLLQDALENTHVWIDGDQGNPKRRKLLDETEKLVGTFAVKQIHRNRGNYGFRKMMIVSMRKMFEMYERVLFIEDDCFPTRQAVKGFSYELDRIEKNPSVFSVYGHPFLTEAEAKGPIGRFQGWGWASTREKLMPIWPSLLDTYLMSEDEYKKYIESELTKKILEHIDVTPGRQPSSTLTKFFAWDEALCFLAGQKGLTHQRTNERLIYNFGVGETSTHFGNIDHYRKPPFNMVSIDEIWSHF